MTKHSTATARVIPFKFEKREVRTLLIDDQPWFVAADVAAALEYREAEKLTRWLDDDEKAPHIVGTPGGDQTMTVINESGLYSAILRSRKAEAKRFKKWVTAEVLPAIRKHGRYEDGGNRMGTLVGRTIGTNGFQMLRSLIRSKVVDLPSERRRRMVAKMWAQTHTAFGVRSAADIPADQLDAARNFIAAYAVEGEYLPRMEDDRQLEISFPVSKWLESDPHSFAMARLDPPGTLRVPIRALHGMDSYSPTWDLLNMLDRAGYEVGACRLELKALKDHLGTLDGMLSDLERRINHGRGRAVAWRHEGPRSSH